MKVWYLFHSGFAVQTANHFFIFDYWRDKPKGEGLKSGVIDTEELRDQDVVVFVSHSHGDHFNRRIFQWKQEIPKLRFILSDDIRNAEEATRIGPGCTLAQPDMTIQTLASNDEGVAFVVDSDGLRIFHAGDLNWWHWEGEPDEDNEGMAVSYKTEINKLAGKPVDLAFIPVDPRLEEQYAWAIDYLMRAVEVRNVVPMHFGNDAYIVDRLLKDPVSVDYRDRILGLVKRGDMREI
jgi:L-ascorbate metabolism protein UlaG (beta-lactamase superfamily)